MHYWAMGKNGSFIDSNEITQQSVQKGVRGSEQVKKERWRET